MKFKVHTQETAPKESQVILNEVVKAYGFLPNLFAVMSEVSTAPETYLTLNKIFEKTSFNLLERQIVLITTSYENECTYCVAAHTVVSSMQGLDEKVISDLRNGKKLEDNKLESLRNFTKEVVETRGWPNDKVKQSFLENGYNEANALEVIIGVSMKTFTNYVNHLAKTPLDENFQSAAWKKAVS
ncbi:MAG: carboxymuconolactone decarboxylase [Candidatus Cloacimonadota bacterium]|nr:MAG: carboxymuconolactone decarboxylase [Candidatus Cloacimonadota bacterium]